MNYLHKLRVYFYNAFLNNKKFIILPYNNKFYDILTLLHKGKYIKNFTYIISKINNMNYIFVELILLDNVTKKFKIIIFNVQLKYSYKSFKKLLKLKNFDGMFIISTSRGFMSLDKANLFKIGGSLQLYIF